MCNCENIEFGSAENYARQILFDIPEHMSNYRDARVKEGLSGKISIDPCIVEEINNLWRLGITTYGSCCGHNKADSFVNVSDKDIQTMINLGYVQNHWDESRKGTFKLKSA